MVTKLSESISKFISILNDAKTRLPALKEELETVEKQQQDILHAIENSEYDDGRKLCSMLKKVRKHRRQIKDDIAIYEPICELTSTLATKGAISIIEQSLGAIRKQERYLENRFYTNRTDILDGSKK